jgi:hypothetical protein
MQDRALTDEQGAANACLAREIQAQGSHDSEVITFDTCQGRISADERT